MQLPFALLCAVVRAGARERGLLNDSIPSERLAEEASGDEKRSVLNGSGSLRGVAITGCALIRASPNTLHDYVTVLQHINFTLVKVV